MAGYEICRLNEVSLVARHEEFHPIYGTQALGGLDAEVGVATCNQVVSSLDQAIRISKR